MNNSTESSENFNTENIVLISTTICTLLINIIQVIASMYHRKDRKSTNYLPPVNINLGKYIRSNKSDNSSEDKEDDKSEAINI